MPPGRLPDPKTPTEKEMLLKVMEQIQELGMRRKLILLEISKLKKQLGNSDVEVAELCQDEVLRRYVGSPKLAKILGMSREAASDFLNMTEFEIKLMKLDNEIG